MVGRKASELDSMAVADQLHSAAIHLLRRVRRHDPDSGLGAARLSALSVIVFGGPITMGELARAEQVQLPTISRLVTSLEQEGLVCRSIPPSDRRVVHVQATSQGRQVLAEARERRIRDLGQQLQSLPPRDLDTLRRAAVILEHLGEAAADVKD
ncbi:MAG: MarR family transcriptional regulator [Chloroflexota bacterium]|nr:MarR family transcriptional regulator [Chloroflexota bacterium]